MRFQTLITGICSVWLILTLGACTPAGDKKPQSGETSVEEQSAEANTDAQIQAPKADLELLLHPEKLNETAPDKFNVKMATTKGDLKIEVDRTLAPIGVDRFYNLVKNGYYNDVVIFRTSCGYVIQFGLHGRPSVSKAWQKAQIKDDPVKGSNTKGSINFASVGPNTRNTQIFINPNDNLKLDQMGFAPLGKITEGMDVIERLNTVQGDSFPDFEMIKTKGNVYLKENFPNLDYIVTMTIE